MLMADIVPNKNSQKAFDSVFRSKRQQWPSHCSMFYDSFCQNLLLFLDCGARASTCANGPPGPPGEDGPDGG